MGAVIGKQFYEKRGIEERKSPSKGGGYDRKSIISLFILVEFLQVVFELVLVV